MEDLTKALNAIDEAIVREYYNTKQMLFAAKQMPSGEDVAEETFALIEQLETFARQYSDLGKRLQHCHANLQQLLYCGRDLTQELSRLLAT